MADIIINEIHPNPEEGFEWVEIYNNSAESISVSRLKLYDQTSKSLKFNKDIIPARAYVAATASAILNNSGDTVILEKDGIVIETITYETIQQGKSYARCNNVWITNVLSTYELINLCEAPSAAPTIGTSEPMSKDVLTQTPVGPYATTSLPKVSSSAKMSQNLEKKIALAPIEFNKKHAQVDQTIPQTKTPAPTKTLITPQIQSTHSDSFSPLLFIGIFSFIQCIFLVYLIIKRIRYGAPTTTQEKND